MKEKRIWVQVAKNFKPIIRLTEEEVREEFFDFDEKILVEAKDLGVGKHQVNAEAYASWQKHDFIEKDEASVPVSPSFIDPAVTVIEPESVL